MDPRIRSIGKVVIKLSLSASALYIVFQNIDSQQLVDLATSANAWLLFASLMAYNGSKVVSSVRLAFYFRANSIHITEADNLRLYYLGMFYNLFLPGGIGGDAYKIWILHSARGVPVKSSFQSLFIDRVSGMMMLSGLAFLFAWLAFPDAPWRNVLLIGLVSVIPAIYAVHHFLAKHFLPIIRSTSVLSLGVQGLQTISAWLLLMSLGVDEHIATYITVFLISSMVSVLPISIGGIGIRELVFISAASFSPISKDVSVAFSLMFFVVTALSSLPGGFLKGRF